MSLFDRYLIGVGQAGPARRSFSEGGIAVLASLLLLVVCAQAPEASGHEKKAPVSGIYESIFDSLVPRYAAAYCRSVTLDTEAAKPLDTEAAKPLDTEAAKPLDTEAAKPLDTEAAKPLDTEAAKPGEAKALLVTKGGKHEAPKVTDRCALVGPQVVLPKQAKDWSELPAGPIEKSLKTWRGHGKNLTVYKITPLPFEDLFPGLKVPTFLKLFEVRSRISSMMHYFDIAAVTQHEKGPRRALLVKGCAAYNKVLDQADIQAGGKRHFVKRVKAYLRVAAGPGARSIMFFEDADNKEKQRDEARSVRGWLAKNMRKFHPPLPKCRSKGCAVKYYSWKQMNGVLYYESVKMDPNGRITEHKATQLASGLGAFSIH